MKATGRIQSLERMDAILDAIASAADGAARLKDIAIATGLHKNTAHSLLRTLAALGYVDHGQESQRYRIGPRSFELARRAERNLDVVGAVRPLMMRLVWQFRESLSLAVAASDSCVVLATVEGTYGVRGSRFQGQHAPYHASALGKAIVAFLPDADRAPLLERIRFEKLTSRTIVTPEDLLADCARVRERGYALSVAEEEVGASAVAAPLFSRGGEVVGALAIWGPSVRLARPRLAVYGARLVAECQTVFAAR